MSWHLTFIIQPSSLDIKVFAGHSVLKNCLACKYNEIRYYRLVAKLYGDFPLYV